MGQTTVFENYRKSRILQNTVAQETWRISIFLMALSVSVLGFLGQNKTFLGDFQTL